MVGSFSWGLIRLLQTLPIEEARAPSDWSFGQVVPLVLLAAPLLTIFESFSKRMSFPFLLTGNIADNHSSTIQQHAFDSACAVPHRLFSD
jgi:hypothetical protein